MKVQFPVKVNRTRLPWMWETEDRIKRPHTSKAWRTITCPARWTTSNAEPIKAWLSTAGEPVWGKSLLPHSHNLLTGNVCSSWLLQGRVGLLQCCGVLSFGRCILRDTVLMFHVQEVLVSGRPSFARAASKRIICISETTKSSSTSNRLSIHVLLARPHSCQKNQQQATSASLSSYLQPGLPPECSWTALPNPVLTEGCRLSHHLICTKTSGSWVSGNHTHFSSPWKDGCWNRNWVAVLPGLCCRPMWDRAVPAHSKRKDSTTSPLAVCMEQMLCRYRTTSDSLALPLGEDSSSNDRRPSLPLKRLKSNSS